ncbi:hypothetical protein HK11_12585 [Acetobacter sp. DmW_043]|nr:hypothetical protein HK11_12585 [Acetobacter sp. DmW_043]
MVTTISRKSLNLFIFFVFLYIGLRLIDPAKFISVEYANKFAIWKDGYVGGENYDDLWVILWVVFSFIFAVIFYKIVFSIFNFYKKKFAR